MIVNKGSQIQNEKLEDHKKSSQIQKSMKDYEIKRY